MAVRSLLFFCKILGWKISELQVFERDDKNQ